MKAISLFSCIGTCEFFLNDLNIEVIVANEVDPKRARLYKHFHKNVDMICGDISKSEIKNKIIKFSENNNVNLIIISPPCQGFSTVGIPKKDLNLQDYPQNYLILESFDIIKALSPNYVIIENVPRFLNLKYFYKNKIVDLKYFLKLYFKNEYEFKINIFDSVDFKVPQYRKRCFIRMFKKGLSWEDPILNNEIVNVYDAIGSLCSLEPGEKSNIKNHWARIHPDNQIKWMRYTPTGKSAFDNAFHYPVKSDGTKIKGYKNCYKRINWDKPSPTITMRNEIISSQNKVHPGRKISNNTWSDARVLTIRELLILMSLSPELDMPDNFSDSFTRQMFGEGIPPKMFKKILRPISLV